METAVSDCLTSRRADRVTLVLGGGWKLGCAFHAGVVLALKDTWGLDARHVDSVIGTSSGALFGGLLGAGLSPEDLFCREAADALSPAGQALLARVGKTDEMVDRKRTSAHAPRLHRTLGLSARGAIAAMLPRGRQSMMPLEHYFDDLIGADWPSEIDLKFCAVDLGSGQRVALDRDSGATVGQAVAASCSVPGVSQPVVIRGREYVDGAIYSINNADLASSANQGGSVHQGDHMEETPVDETRTVIVSAPLSVNHLRPRFGPMGILRNAMHVQTAAEVRKLRDVDQLIVLEPDADNLSAMGSDMNAARRRGRVAESAYTRGTEVLRDARPLSSTRFDQRPAVG